jgi:hypothetical protein
MTAEEFHALKPGDFITSDATGELYIVTANYGDRVTAVRSVDLTNPDEWHQIAKRRP